MRRALIFSIVSTCAAGCYQSHLRPELAGDAAALDTAAHDAATVDAHADDAAPLPCGSSTCGPGEICVTGRCAGCCDLPPACLPIPAGCTGELSCGCFATDPCGGCTTCLSVTAAGVLCGNCMCECAAPWTPIATPSGPRAIAELRVGDLVYSVDRGEVVVVPLSRVGRRSVTRHLMVRITLTDGEQILMSRGHPTAEGRHFDTLAPGDHLGLAEVGSVETVLYDEAFTYDILPESESGTYFVGGALIGSTMHVPDAPMARAKDATGR